MVFKLIYYKTEAFETIFLFSFSSKKHFYNIQKIFNLDYITIENNEENNKKWPYIPDHPFKILIIGGSISEKTNVLLNLIKEQDSDNLIDKIYLYAKDLCEPKYQFLTKKRDDVGIKRSKNIYRKMKCYG